eukprot:3668581-Pleurochrysis_carterae.AAC.1
MPAASGGVHAAFTWATMSRGAATRLSAGSDSSYLQLSHSPVAYFSHAPNSACHAHGSAPFPRACGMRIAQRKLKVCTAPGGAPDPPSFA